MFLTMCSAAAAVFIIESESRVIPPENHCRVIVRNRLDFAFFITNFQIIARPIVVSYSAIRSTSWPSYLDFLCIGNTIPRASMRYL
jgi:hypothetical protein